MSTEPSPKGSWAQHWRVVAAFVVASLYLAAVIRVIASENWNDIVASRLFGLSLVISGALFLVALATATPMSASTDARQKRWPTRRAVATSIAVCLSLGGAIWLIVSWDIGDRIAQLLGQTGVVAFMLFSLIGWIPLRPLNDETRDQLPS
ncbi:hypothetical protein ACFVJ5_30115 [Nocardia sp. NPDC127606]|uniref:hypothetical protein n=1 Tax=Nocardia sp. NPDC127606 TaxID=3345406 RepID=UPI003634B5AB